MKGEIFMVNTKECVIPSATEFNLYEKYIPIFGSIGMLCVTYYLRNISKFHDGAELPPKFITIGFLVVGLGGLIYSLFIQLPRINWNRKNARIEFKSDRIIEYRNRKSTMIMNDDISKIIITESKTAAQNDTFRATTINRFVSVVNQEDHRVMFFNASAYEHIVGYLEETPLQTLLIYI